MTILDKIIAYKKEEVARAKSETPFNALETLAKETARPRGFENALRKRAQDSYALIAEIKKASPSKGLIRKDFDPSRLAAEYEKGGAACLSVLTDAPSFQGSPEHLRHARATTSLPIIRKDFMIDTYQVAEARAWGADCVLLIMACLCDEAARDLSAAAQHFGLDILIETHDEHEVERALKAGPGMIGVNNRNLKSFVTDISTTERLAPLVPPDRLLVSESGINRNADLARLRAAGAKAFLVGESLMREDNVENATRVLLAGAQNA